MKNVLLLLFVILLTSCTSIRHDLIIDGSSPETTKKSLNTIFKRLNSKEKLELFKAMIAIQYSDVSSYFQIIDDPTMTNEINYFIIGKKVDGLSYYQVLELASQSQTKVSAE